jgi:uridine kinase
MLFRTELDDAWDYRVFVHADFDISLDRALARDLDHFGSEEAIRRKHSLRFRPAQQRYLAETRPADVADAWIDNNNPEYPVLELRPNTGHRAERSIQGA